MGAQPFFKKKLKKPKESKETSPQYTVCLENNASNLRLPSTFFSFLLRIFAVI